MPVSQLATRLLLSSQRNSLVAVRSLSSMLKPVSIKQTEVNAMIKPGALFHTQSPQLIYSSCKLCSAEKVDSGSKDHIKSLVDKRDVVVFMKGVPEQPMCGFSNAVVQILRMHGVEYDSYNVLDDENLRAGIKTYSEWPTIPQIYLKGEFVGGCDILLQMHQSGDLVEELKSVGIRSALLDKENEK